MRQINVPGAGLVNFPEGMSDEDIVRAIEDEILPQLARENQKPRTVMGTIGAAASGIPAGALGLIESALIGSSAALPTEAERVAREQLAERVARFKDRFTPEEQYRDNMSRKFTEGVGSTVPFLALGALGPKGVAAGIGLGVAAGAGEARIRAEQAEATPEERGRATALGVIPGAIEVIPPFRILSRLTGRQLNEAKSLAMRALQAGGEEAAQEALSGYLQNEIARGVYKPDQDVIEGLGEDAAYGAAVGSFVQGMMDLMFRTRGTAPRTMTEEEAATIEAAESGAPIAPPADPTTLAPPAPPMATAPGEVQQLTDYDRSLLEGQFPPVTQEAAAEQFPGDLFPLQRVQAEAAVSGIQGPQAPVAPVAPEVAPEVAPDTAPAQVGQQLELGLPEPSRTPPQDIVNLIGEQNEREIAAVRAARAEEEKIGALRLRSDIAELDASIQNKQQKTAQDRRLELLLPLISDPNVSSIPAAFDRALKQEGVRDTQFTEREQNLISRAQDVRAAITDTSAAQTAAPEGVATPRTPEQLTLPGVMGRQAAKRLGRTRPVETQPEAVEDTLPSVLTEASMDDLMLPKSAMARKRLVGKDITNPAQRQAVVSELQAIVANPRTASETRNRVQDVLDSSPALRSQGEMFDSLGEISPGAVPPRRTRDDAATTEPTTERPASESSVGVASVGDGPAPSPEGATGAVSEPEVGGLATAPTGTPSDISGVKPADGSPLTETTAPTTAPVQPAPPTGFDGEGNAAWQGLATEPLVAFTDAVSPEYLSLSPTDVGVVGDTAQITRLLVTPNAQLDAEGKAAKTYFSKMPRLIDNLRNIAFDVVYNPPRYRRAPEETAAEAEFFKGMSGVAARDAQAWVSKNLAQSARDAYSALSTEYANQKVMSDSQYIMDLLGQDATVTDYIQQEAKDTLNRISKATDDGSFLTIPSDTNMATRLHPIIAGQLRANNLRGALRSLSKSTEGSTGALAQKFASLLGADTQVRVVTPTEMDAVLLARESSQAGENGENVQGVYYAETNELFLNSVIGLDAHTLLHETGHAVLDKTLGNPAHPFTKQMKSLFEAIRPRIASAYGSRNLKEFVAEAYSNESFREQLDTITPTGSDVTALRRFMNHVTNFFRNLVGASPKGIDTALSRIDRALATIATPGDLSTTGPITAQEASMLRKGDQLIDTVVAAERALPPLTDTKIDKFNEFARGTAPNKIKSFVKSALPLNALVDMSKSFLPSAPKFEDIIYQKSGRENQLMQSIEPITKEIGRFAKSRTMDEMMVFNDLVYDSTLDMVDPSRPESTYAKEPDKLNIWREMQPRWSKLGADGQRAYQRMRDTYKKLYSMVDTAIGARIDDLAITPDQKRTMKEQILAKVRERINTIDPFFPLTRKGDYWLSYNTYNPRTGTMEMAVEAFETQSGRERMMAELVNNVPPQLREEAQAFAQEQGISYEQAARHILAPTPFARLNEVRYDNAPPGSFMNEVLRILQENNADPQTTQEMLQLFVENMPETSYTSSLRERKGTMGFNRDAFDAFKTRVYSMSRQLAALENNAKISQAMQEIQEQATLANARGNPLPLQYAQEYAKRAQFALNPRIPKWSNAATGAAFAMTLGFNFSSAIVNMSQLPLVVTPYYGGKYGYGETVKAIGGATRVFFGSGTTQERLTLLGDRSPMRVAFSIDNYNYTDPNLDPRIMRFKNLARVAGDMGQLNRSQVNDILATEDIDNPMAKVNGMTGFVFHHGERFNRQVSIIAAFDLEMARMDKALTAEDRAGIERAKASELERLQTRPDPTDPAENNLNPEQLEALAESNAREVYAAEKAVHMAELTNSGIASSAAPRIAQNGIGKVLMMFKRYGISMYYLQFKAAREAMATPAEITQLQAELSQAITPRERASLEARLAEAQKDHAQVKAIARRQIAGIYGSAALMSGVQGVPLFGAAAMVYDLLKDDDEDTFRTEVRKYMGELPYKGAINHLVGTDVSARISLSDLLYRDDSFQKDVSLTQAAGRLLGGPVVGVAEKSWKGAQDIREGNTMRGIEQMLPTAFGNVLKSYRFGTEGALSRRGDPIMEEFGPSALAAQALGFSPAPYTRQQEINAMEKQKERVILERGSKLRNRYFLALRQNDTEALTGIIQDIQEFNSRYPEVAITADQLRKSMRQRFQVSAQMLGGVSYNRRLLGRTLQSLAEYEDED